MKKILQDLSLEELEAELTAQGEKKFRAAQIYGGMLRVKCRDRQLQCHSPEG